ncbi:thiol-disulfide oxidoreductase DCC family protein [Membranihabitans marinus]|uniref:thiol-disulfide oxidoreductase DCC family protein n=1 Tax=Membranihabitans marinus TaxID=1227546 RepID=UPI001F380066|nr:DUF393 domain-containing protein [Membranihabitans marinus]
MKHSNSNSNNHSYIIYDGACGFCNRGILFIAHHDDHNKYSFVSNLSDLGKQLLIQYKMNHLVDKTIVLIEDQPYIKSTAVKRIIRNLPQYSFLYYFLLLLPRPIADFAYDLVAKYRKKLMPNNTCPAPSPEIQKKFIL